MIRRRRTLRHTKKPYVQCHVRNVESQTTVSLSQERMLLLKWIKYRILDNRYFERRAYVFVEMEVRGGRFTMMR